MTTPQGAERDRLPVSALLAMAMTGFIAILTETLPAGLLPQIARGLDVSEPVAGQLVTLYAAGTVVAAIPITFLTQGWRRKPTLLTAIIVLFVFNTVTALSSSYALTLSARLIAGMATGMAWAILGGYARRLVVDRLKGRALAMAMVGTPLALSLGVPAGSFIGALVGWRIAFLGMSALTVGLIGWVLVSVPDVAGQPTDRQVSIRKVFVTPGVRPILVTIFAWMAAHNILYTYVAPFAAHAGVARLDLLLLGFGLAALVGIAVTGALVDRMLRVLVLASLAAFAVVAALFGLLGTAPLVAVVGTLVWGLSFGGAATQLQTASADASGDGADLANAMNATVWNGAIAVGGMAGGFLLDRLGAATFPWAMLPLILIAFAVAATNRDHAFKPGRRAGD